MFKRKNIEYQDDFLKNLIQKTELCCPSDDFVENVMSLCCQEDTVERFSFQWISWLKQSTPWILTSVFFITIIVLSLVFNVSIFSLFGLKLLSSLKIYQLIITGIIGVVSGVILLSNKLKENFIIE
jgi:hypothetical protein